MTIRSATVQIDIRRARADDAALIGLLGRVTFRETFSHCFKKHPRDLVEHLDATFSVHKLEASLAKSRNCYWLGLVDGLPVGYVKCRHPSPNELIADVAPVQLQKLYVLTDFLSFGVGHALMETVLSDAANRAATIWLAVLASNDRAIRFHRRHGLMEAGRTSFTIGAQCFPFLVLQRSTIETAPERMIDHYLAG